MIETPIPEEYHNGMIYFNAKKYNDAIECFKKAANQGYIHGWCCLGEIYYFKLKNYNDGIKYYELAADQGDAIAQYRLGKHYQGRGEYSTNNNEDERMADYVRAIRYYNLSATQGHKDAENAVSSMHMSIILKLAVKHNNQEAIIIIMSYLEKCSFDYVDNIAKRALEDNQLSENMPLRDLISEVRLIRYAKELESKIVSGEQKLFGPSYQEDLQAASAFLNFCQGKCRILPKHILILKKGTLFEIISGFSEKYHLAINSPPFEKDIPECYASFWNLCNTAGNKNTLTYLGSSPNEIPEDEISEDGANGKFVKYETFMNSTL